LFSREGHCRRFWFLRFGHFASTFLHSLAPPELPGFLTTMSALTPVGRSFLGCIGWLAPLGPDADLRPGRFGVVCPAPLFPESFRLVPTGLPVSQDRVFRPFRLQPPLAVPGSVCFAPGLTAFCLDHPVCRDRTASWALPLPSRLTTTTGRIEFVILRTGRSPSVALHPLSQGRSYFRLQSSNQTLTGTSIPLIRSAHRRTRTDCQSVLREPLMQRWGVHPVPAKIATTIQPAAPRRGGLSKVRLF